MLERLEVDYISIRDNGLTEIQQNTLTCVCLGLLEKDDKLIKRLQLYKNNM